MHLLLRSGGTPKYINEDASSKMFLVSDFNNFKIVDSRSVTEQYNELLNNTKGPQIFGLGT
jgi:hypothetical protein